MSEKADEKDVVPDEEYPRYVEGYRFAAQEVKLSLEHKYQSLASQKDFGKLVFGSASLILSLIAALQIFSKAPAPQYRGIVSVLLTISVLLYLGLIYVCLRIVRPTDVTVPFLPEFSNLYNAFIGRDDEMILLDQIVVNYLLAIEQTEEVVSKQRKQVKLAAWTLGALVVLVFLTNFFVSLP